MNNNGNLNKHITCRTYSIVFPSVFSEDVHQCEKHRGTEDGGVSRSRNFVFISGTLKLTNGTLGLYQRHNAPQRLIGFSKLLIRFDSKGDCLFLSHSSFFMLQ